MDFQVGNSAPTGRLSEANRGSFIFVASCTTMDMCWDISSLEEADFIASMISEWRGGKMYKREYGETFYDWICLDYTCVFLAYDEDGYV